MIKIRDYIENRISYERELHNPLLIFEKQELPEPYLNYAAMEKKYKTRTSEFERFPGGYYATPDEKLRLIVVYMRGKGLETALKMKEEINKALGEINPKNYARDLEVKFTGNIQNMIEESAALVADLELSTAIVMVLVTAMMIFFYRSLWGTTALTISLFMGVFWTFGLAYFVVGYLNANTAFLASIVIGNGINFGIMLLARYMEERRNLLTHEEALEIAMTQSAGATWTAALAAGLAYGSLILTGFRGFNQFGIIGLIGMIFCWVSAFTVLPALLTVIDRRFDYWIPIKPQKSYVSGWL